MQVTNIRLGFATNSSSSHSIIFSPSLKVGRQYDDSMNCEPYQYDWGWFILDSPNQKSKYLQTAVMQSLVHIFDRDKCIELMCEWFGYDWEHYDRYMPCSETYKSDSAYMDHQSAFSFTEEQLNKTNIQRLDDLFKSDNIVVFGGNDNEEPPILPFPFDGETISIHSGIPSLVSRSDGNNIVYYNKYTGNKIRVSLDDSPYEKSTYPELVDIKITDYCPFGCSFCYQSSTINGVHSSIESIIKIADLLQKMQVFEVALGGGEPTMHPQFDKILKIFFERGITPNFTTFTSKWIKNSRIKSSVSKYCGGIGVSVHHPKDLAKVKEINCLKMFYSNSNSPKVMAQHVVGSLPEKETVNLIKQCGEDNIPMLLLGYKNVGFGGSFKRFKVNNFPYTLKLIVGSTTDEYTISVDTALLDEFPDFPNILDVDTKLFTKKEGQFSCYIDAVNMTTGPSSYVSKNEMVALPSNLEDFVSLYASW